MAQERHRSLFDKKQKAKDTKGTLKRIWTYLNSNRKALFLTFFLSGLTAILGIIATRMSGYAIDDYIVLQDQRGLFSLCALLLTVYLLGVLSTYYQNRKMVRIAQHTSANLRRDLYGEIQLLPIEYFDTHPSGDIMSRLTNDVDQISMTISENLTQLFGGVVNIVGMTFAMLLLSPILFLVGILTLPLTILLTKLLVRLTQPSFKAQQKELGLMNGYIEEHISGQKIILTYGQEEKVEQEFEKINHRIRKHGVIAQALSGLMGPISNAINNLSYFLIAITGAYIYIRGGEMSVGVIFTFVLYMRNFTRPINQIMNMFNTIQAALAGAERVFEVMDEKKEVSDQELYEQEGGKKNDMKINGQIDFHQVQFSYEKAKPILKNLSFQAKAGQTIAIVGHTGSGKTTIINLINRFYPVDAGKIEIDGRNIQEFSLYELRRKVALVLQDTFLFSESIGENIAYGHPNASREQVEEAARLANAHHFIEQLPEGYDTILEDNGSNLSHGQRQLLAIARAILSEGAILILDEATSSIDTNTELLVQEALLKLMEGKTTFIIAHRLSTIRHADCILVIEEGEIAEQGSHEELIQQKGLYAALCQSQYKGIAI